MDGMFGSLLLRVFVRGWCRKNEQHLTILSTWIELLERGQHVSERHVAAASGQPSPTVHKVLAAFKRDVRAAQLEEEAIGTSMDLWLKDGPWMKEGAKDGPGNSMGEGAPRE